MIPPFEDNGYLPPGVHRATMAEIAERFGQASELRTVQFESLEWLVDLANRSGVLRIIINGSFTTDEPTPNDVDCALLIGPGYPKDAAAEAELQAGLPFLQIDLANQADFDFLVDSFYSTDRNAVPKGVVEVIQ